MELLLFTYQIKTFLYQETESLLDLSRAIDKILDPLPALPRPDFQHLLTVENQGRVKDYYSRMQPYSAAW
jgi:hypothetical protein